jgi:hypothetical protein
VEDPAFAQTLVDYPLDQHDVRIMVGAPKALALAWILGYLKNVNGNIEEADDDNSYGGGDPVTLRELIETAESHLNSSNRWGGDYITRGGSFEGMGTDPTFWEKYAILKDIPLTQEMKNSSFFSCSC